MQGGLNLEKDHFPQGNEKKAYAQSGKNKGYVVLYCNPVFACR